MPESRRQPRPLRTDTVRAVLAARDSRASRATVSTRDTTVDRRRLWQDRLAEYVRREITH